MITLSTICENIPFSTTSSPIVPSQVMPALIQSSNLPYATTSSTMAIPYGASMAQNLPNGATTIKPMTVPYTSTSANPISSTYGATSGVIGTQQIATGNVALAGNQVYSTKL